MARKAVLAGVLLMALLLCWNRAGWTSAVQAKGNETWAHGAARGMVLGLYSDGNGKRYEKDLDELADLGVNAVSLHVPWVIDNVQASHISREPWITPSDRRLRQCIRAARKRGMEVMLFPLLFVDKVAPGKWRGTLDPEDRPAWDQAYKEFLLHYARLAREEGVTWLSIGNELLSMESRELFWRSLIRKVRGEFNGRLIYGLNWDQLDRVRFQDALDGVALNGYFEIAGGAGAGEPDQEQALAAWQAIRRDLELRFAGKPLVFTELGYRSVGDGLTRPWDHGTDLKAMGGLSPRVQEAGYRAFLQAFADSSSLEGVFVYMWWGDGGPADGDYTPRGKPAADTLKSFWGTPRLPGKK